MNLRICTALTVLMIGAGLAKDCWAWGATGHEWVSGIAIEKLPDEIPAFVRAPEAVAELAVMGRELDRSKGAGKTHDAERDPGHYINLDDDGTALGAVALTKLPVTREEYDTLLRAKGSTQYKNGCLPYSIVDGWQQIGKDFAYWRAAAKGIETATTPADKAWFEADLRLREKLTLRDIGIWTHYVGDASQPLHVSIHYNGWGDYPNPNGYTNSKTIHAHFEGRFVRENLTRAAIAAKVAPYQECGCPIEQRARDLIRSSLDQVAPLYVLDGASAFRRGSNTGDGADFATLRLAVGAQAARDMIVDAWRASADAMVGFPMVNVRDIESGKTVTTRATFGAD